MTENNDKRLEAASQEKKAALSEKEIAAQFVETLETIKTGKGILKLETPIKAGDEDITELPYDFTALTGLEYTNAMDSDMNSTQAYRITYRQGLALFAMAASKEVDQLDMRDITEKISITDAVEAVQLATLFFNASTRAGQMRISKKS